MQYDLIFCKFGLNILIWEISSRLLLSDLRQGCPCRTGGWRRHRGRSGGGRQGRWSTAPCSSSETNCSNIICKVNGLYKNKFAILLFSMYDLFHIKKTRTLVVDQIFNHYLKDLCLKIVFYTGRKYILLTKFVGISNRFYGKMFFN